MATEAILDLLIDRLVQGGRGMGYASGKAVFVPLTAPGDHVRCRVVKEKKNYIEAKPIEILAASTRRRQPPCPLFGDCGGCQWQHLTYADQMSWKEQLFTDQLTRVGVADRDSILPIVPSPTEFHYRNRVQFKCRMMPGGFMIGFFRTGSHYIVDVDRCLLVQPAIQDVLTVMRRELGASPAPDGIPQIDVSCGDDGQVQLVVHVLPAVTRVMAAWLNVFAREHTLAVSMQTGRKNTLLHIHGETDQILHIPSSEMTLKVSPGGFAQVNSGQNRALVETVIRHADLRGCERVLDLFCGVGNFSLPLARHAIALDGVEAYAPAIADACHNAEYNRLDNTRFYAEDAGVALDRLWSEGPYDLVVLDPPRAGCYNVTRILQRHRPGRIIYVSCDPVTLTRDLMPLVNDGYRVVSSQPFDLFPQTGHTESVTMLETSGRS